MNKLHPKAVWVFFFRYLRMISLVFIAVVFLAVLNIRDPLTKWMLLLLLGFLILYSLFCYFWARLTYRYWRYELTEKGIKWEYGVVYKKSALIPYERIQNVDIHRGLLDRIFGLSDLRIQTAGGLAGKRVRFLHPILRPRISSGINRAGAEGRLLGLSKQKAEELSNELIERAEKS